jgi:hypothetical protein
MRTRLLVPLPPDATGRQLLAVGVLADQLGQGRWADLARSFARLDQRAATVPAPMAELLGTLAGALRRAGADLDDDQGPELELERAP